jgi:hypothetical protein
MRATGERLNKDHVGRIARRIAVGVLMTGGTVITWPAIASASGLVPPSTSSSTVLTTSSTATSIGSVDFGAKKHKAKITAVEFSGTSASPAFTVTGINFGTMPAKPVRPPCKQTTDPGSNYGKAIYFNDKSTAHWQAGTGRDCIGLVIGSWSDSSISFTLGSWYSWSKGGAGQGTILNNGDPFTMTVKGAHFSGTVAGLS